MASQLAVSLRPRPEASPGAVAGHPEADAVYGTAADPAETLAAVRTADCVPILLAGPGGRWVAAVHAGWRGTAGGIATKVVMELAKLGVPPIEWRAAIGPAIGRCCYEVSAEVAEQVARTSGADPSIPAEAPDKRYLDLQEANRLQLAWSGLREDRIHVAPFCTSCRPDLFFSYRREGAAAGRQMALIGTAARAR